MKVLHTFSINCCKSNSQTDTLRQSFWLMGFRSVWGAAWKNSTWNTSAKRGFALSKAPSSSTSLKQTDLQPLSLQFSVLWVHFWTLPETLQMQTLSDVIPNNRHFHTADGLQDREKVGMSTHHIFFWNDHIYPSAAVFHCTKLIRARLIAALWWIFSVI